MGDHMKGEFRDRWSKLDVTAKALGTLLIPVIIFFIGYQFNSEQSRNNYEQRMDEQAAAKSQHETDRMALLLTHLSSTNPTEQKLALAFVEYLAHSDQFPPEFLPIVVSTLSDKDTSVVKATSDALAEIAKSRPATRDSLVKTISRRPDLKTFVKRDQPATKALRQELPDSLK